MKDYSSYVGIVGGGIGGLTAGCALRLQGIKAIVFERTDKVSEHGAGISISPNGLRILEELGIKQLFANRSCIPKKAVFHYLNEEILSLKSEVVTSSRQKLLQVIHQRYIELGGEILFEHELKDLDQSSCELTFANNQSCKVSHVLACDGIKSSIRQKYFPSSGRPTYSGYSAWRGIGTSNARDIQFHFGPGTHIVNYPIDNQGRTSFVGIVQTKEVAGDSWKIKGSKEMMLKDFKFYDEEMFSMINSSNDIYRWSIYIRPSLKSMCSNNITLLGDAAHPMVPFLGQGGCMAIEDAYTFGLLAGKLDSDFMRVQALYEKVRLKRNNKIQSASIMQGKLNHIKNPIAAFIRNFIMQYTPMVSTKTKKIWDYDVNKELRKFL